MFLILNFVVFVVCVGIVGRLVVGGGGWFRRDLDFFDLLFSDEDDRVGNVDYGG